MSLKKFKKNDIIYNTLRTHPNCHFYIYDGQMYYNSKKNISGVLNGTTVLHMNNGSISLYEKNVDRDSNNLIFPFITKQSDLTSFKSISQNSLNSNYEYGSVIAGVYPLTSSLGLDYFPAGSTRSRIYSLRNTLRWYNKINPSFSNTNIYNDSLKLISIPTIFYGSTIEKGTTKLKFYLSGTLISELNDERKDGVLYQVGPKDSSNSGSAAGLVLYNEGFVILTGSWDLSGGLHTEDYVGAGLESPKWVHFAEKTSSTPSSSYAIEFNGTNKIPTMTLFAHAEKGELNHSNNPTYIKYNSNNKVSSGSYHYKEDNEIEIKNIIKSPYLDPLGTFEKQTYISKINIYDEDKNIIAVAKLANVIKKRSNKDFTFKLKMDF